MAVSRRDVLAGMSATIAGLAGCSASHGSQDRAADGSQERASGSVRDPETLTVRNPDGETVIVHDGPRFAGDGFVTEESWFDDVSFADDLAESEIDAVETFVAGTDFSEQFLYLITHRVDSCMRRKVLSLQWGPSNLDVDMCWQLRPPDESCEADRSEPRAKFVRVDGHVDPEGISSFGTSASGCRGGDVDYETIDLNESEQSD